jgi:hypothetical protein
VAALVGVAIGTRWAAAAGAGERGER